MVYLQKRLKMYFELKILPRESEFADFREINRAKTSIGASVAEHF